MTTINRRVCTREFLIAKAQMRADYGAVWSVSRSIRGSAFTLARLLDIEEKVDVDGNIVVCACEMIALSFTYRMLSIKAFSRISCTPVSWSRLQRKQTAEQTLLTGQKSGKGRKEERVLNIGFQTS